MPELRVGERVWSVASGGNLLDALNQAGVRVPYSCRAGSCHACLVHCLQGEPQDNQPNALTLEQRERGWRLACQCQMREDLHLEIFDPLRDGALAHISELDWFSPTVLRLRLLPERPLRYCAGQHLVLWTTQGVARPYSLASLPQEDCYLEFHLDCRLPGEFSDAARGFRIGEVIRLGELRGGALHYNPDWHARPLWLLAAGTGLGPLWGVLREALRQGHAGPIRLVHLASCRHEHYLATELAELAGAHGNVTVQYLEGAELAEFLAKLRLASRQTLALLCGAPASVEVFAKRLYLLGLPRNQLLADVFLPRG
ncbi:hypothetical protein AWM79_11870 [Pseudomonas agarici]|uniref:Iron-sulfur-binding ferredoxin reductase n=1 Tax=Pseudomonas agarici TaxID=46677 RepID=A0A0X1T272_PSEAA|nr:iron-sulfur-binding ferredoxin reductase [Pseudomonas agarici]AMB85959.1 hypothetical protein AWM79_11870 [Pseudomonas agarici]